MKRILTAVIAFVFLAGASSSNSKLTERQRAQHALNRLAFGARPGDVDRIARVGVDAWIEQQLHPERISDAAVDARLAPYATLNMSNAALIGQFYRPIAEARRDKKDEQGGGSVALRDAREKSRRVLAELTAQRILRAAESERQLNEVMVDFWMNHFNVFAGKSVDRFLLTGYERDSIRPHIWGRFEELLMATAKSPAMLVYLDNARSRSGALNENYAREIMELHTLGVDGGYTQTDVTEMARVFTGWTVDRRTGEFAFRPGVHDRGAKRLLSVRFPAGGGREEGETMIRFLARQPATARRVATKLCQRLVADDPPKELIDRVAGRFLATDGDLRQTVKSVIESPEFRDPVSYGGKVKSPFEYVISALRASNAEIANPLPVARALQQIGEPLYGAQPPTGYSEKSEVWINTGALMNRLEFALALAENRMGGVRVQTADANKLALELGSPEFQKQ